MGLPFGLTPGDIIELIVLCGAGIGVIWGVRYEVRVMKHDLRNISQRQVALESQINSMEHSMADQFDRVERDLGETITAMREKITQVELFMRDNFVRKDTFSPVLGEIKTSIQNMGSAIEGRLLRLESRLDQIKGKV